MNESKVTDKIKLAFKCLYIGVTVALFMNIFISSELPWRSKYLVFGVPANSWPGGDSRNIQIAAYCNSIKEAKNKLDCMNDGAPVKNIYPDATIPALNYPSLVVELYAFFSDGSEEFFIKFWMLNALVLIGTVLCLSWRYGFSMLPLLIFNPITLLAIERGNTDAIIFCIIFLPLLMFKKLHTVNIFFIGVASSLKLFPVLSYAAMAYLWGRKNFYSVLLGVGLSCPFVIISMCELARIISSTPKSFVYGYGFLSLLYVPVHKLPPFIANGYLVGACLSLLFLFIFSIWLLRWMSRSWNGARDIDAGISQLNSIDQKLLLVSLMVFLPTFLIFVSYAYRLIYLIPIFLVLRKMSGSLVKFSQSLILLILWSPIVPIGWILSNLLCYPLALSLIFITIRLITVLYIYPENMDDLSVIASSKSLVPRVQDY